MLTFLKQSCYGKTALQPLFEKLYQISLCGMNIGGGGTIETSGELYTLKLVYKFFENEKLITIFDVGANKGEYAESVVKVFTKKPFRLFVFEPSQTAFSLLSNNTAIANSKISLINKGISDAVTTATLYTNTPGSKLGSIYHREVPGKEFNEKEEINLTTIDAFCAEKNIDHINFLKLDIEGNEVRALNGAKNVLNQRSIDVIQFEFGGANIDGLTYFRDFWNLLSPEYQIFRILKNGLREISTYNEKLELFSTTNYLAIKKELSKNIWEK